MTQNRVHLFLGIVIALILLFLPKLLPVVKIHLAAEILAFILFAVSFNLLFGYTGLLAFGFAAVFGVGAYAEALLINWVPGMPLLLTLLIAALSGCLTGLVIGALSVRLAGTYFALITFAFQMFLYAVALKWRSVTNGDDGIGITRPDLWVPFWGKISIAEINSFYYLTLVLVGLGVLAAYLFLKTPLGNSVVCMRENQTRSSFLGYNIFVVKVTSFAFSGLLAGLAGAIFVLFNEFVATNCIDMNMSFAVLLMTIIGGSGHLLGPALGAAFYIVFQDWVSSLTPRWWIYIGALYVVVVMYLPGGLISLFQWDNFRFGRRRE